MAYTANKLRPERAPAARLRSGQRLGDDRHAQPGDEREVLPLSDGFQNFLAGLFHSVGTGTITTFRIFVSDDAAGVDQRDQRRSHAIGSNPDAVGDTLWLEATAEQCKAALATAAYVGVKITLGTSTDECIVFFERAERRFKYDTLTADYVQRFNCDRRSRARRARRDDGRSARPTCTIRNIRCTSTIAGLVTSFRHHGGGRDVRHGGLLRGRRRPTALQFILTTAAATDLTVKNCSWFRGTRPRRRCRSGSC
jgi:hypothetical protein